MNSTFNVKYDRTVFLPAAMYSDKTIKHYLISELVFFTRLFNFVNMLYAEFF